MNVLLHKENLYMTKASYIMRQSQLTIKQEEGDKHVKSLKFKEIQVARKIWEAP